MNAKASALGLEETHFVNPHGLDETGHVSSAEDATKLLRFALGIPFIRDAVDRSSVELPGGREFPTTDDLLDSWPPLLGGKTGHTADAGWSRDGSGTGPRRDRVRHRARRREPHGRNEALQELLTYGLGQYHRVAAIDAARTYAEAETGYGQPVVRLVAPRTVGVTVREGKPLVERIVAPGVVELPVRKGQRLGKVEVYDGDRLVASSRLVAAESRVRAGLARQGDLVREANRCQPVGDLLVIVTVTVNAALDRTLTVPVFQIGFRHRSSEVMTLAGGKGINVARALKGLDVPGRRDRARRGADGHAARRGADLGGDPQRLRPDRRRVAHLDRSRRPDLRARTPRSTSGAPR